MINQNIYNNLNPATEGNQQAGGSSDFVMDTLGIISRLESNIENFNDMELAGMNNPSGPTKVGEIRAIKRSIACYDVDILNNDPEKDLWRRLKNKKLNQLRAMGCEEAVNKYLRVGYWT